MNNIRLWRFKFNVGNEIHDLYLNNNFTSVPYGTLEVNHSTLRRSYS